MEKPRQKKGLIGWIDYRLPIFSFLEHFNEYQTPKNLSYLWSFGSIAGIVLTIQILTGIVLAMHYTPHVQHAFDSVEHIMRDVNYGWLLRYMHAIGASMFFLAVYVHIARGLYYGSYRSPREVLWFLGIFTFLVMMATAFMGYVLPWGQMSFWGATVITNLFSAIPVVGDSVVKWLWGGFSVDNPTLNRFFSLHYLLPFLIVGLVLLHIIALHQHGSNNPTGVEVKSNKDTIPFHPYYTIKDFVGFSVFFLIYAGFIFFAPNSLGEPDNYIPANPLVTPTHIVPEWYFLPYYAMLRAIPSKLGGVIVMFSSILIWFFVPWLDRSKVRSGRYRPKFKLFYWVFIVNFLVLVYLGAQLPEGIYVVLARICTLYYFAYFLLALPLLSKHEKTLPEPASINDDFKKAKAVIIIALTFSTLLFSNAASAQEGKVPLKETKWEFEGIFGTVDKRAAQRGYQVYKEVCAACHSMKYLSFRNLTDLGFSPEEAKALAAGFQIKDGPNDQGDMYDRPGRPSDRFPSPFANEKAARASNNGAAPPDLSLIIKARPNGANYVYSLLQGFSTPPAGMVMANGMNYNKYFPGNQIAMPPPLSDGQVQYMDGTNATVEQMSHDVVTFLQWAAEPEMEHRKQTGIKVLLFLFVMTGFFYVAKKRVWSKIK